jgi:hypothetical protein
MEKLNSVFVVVCALLHDATFVYPRLAYMYIQSCICTYVVTCTCISTSCIYSLLHNYMYNHILHIFNLA